jgi:hypothetical protein
LKRAQFISHSATFFVHFTPFLGIIIIGQVLIGCINSLHEHIILRNAKRLEIKSEMISSSWREFFSPQTFLFFRHDAITGDSPKLLASRRTKTHSFSLRRDKIEVTYWISINKQLPSRRPQAIWC